MNTGKARNGPPIASCRRAVSVFAVDRGNGNRLVKRLVRDYRSASSETMDTGWLAPNTFCVCVAKGRRGEHLNPDRRRHC